MTSRVDWLATATWGFIFLWVLAVFATAGYFIDKALESSPPRCTSAISETTTNGPTTTYWYPKGCKHP